ncbi:hypothetical protein K502DRAFT_365222 [Neoconidiobolus thromboides FSU 785]|nr:hypothetical protein K502DRAFT_365222 [Neoconidiobolus thromboides FSU 785]
MKSNIASITLFSFLSTVISASDPVCDSTGSIPIVRYTLGDPNATQCIENTGFCAQDGGYYECKNNKYVKGSCSCPNRFCTKKAMFIECERKYSTDPVCESTGSLPITRYVAGKPDDKKCQEGTGFCAQDGDYYICKNNEYVKDFCKCPNRFCTKKALFIECERRTPPVDPACEGTASIPITRYTEGKPGATQCEQSTGFCAEDGGYYECKDNKYVKSFCKCPGRVCRKKAMFIECEKVYS